jgi:dTDP-4-amino-4,6-dideoxygalactose transaminase
MEIPVAKPLIEKEEIGAAVAALEMGWLGMGSYVGQLEDELSVYLGLEDRRLALVSTGTDAIHLGLLVAGVGPGDEVIAPSLNFISDIAAIMITGADPVVCDVRDDSVCIDLDKAERLITEKTKAIIAMDYSCCLCDYAKLDKLAAKYKLRVVHDACHSFGSTYRGKKIGSFSDICVFSFGPIKTMTCIDGGAVIVRTQEELEHIQELRQLGTPVAPNVLYQNKKKFTFDIQRLGFRDHMPNLHAAIGLEQLKKMPRITKAKRDACIYYNEKLSNIKGLRVPASDFIEIVPFLYYLRIENGRRDDFRDYLREHGVGTGLHWIPNHKLTLVQQCRKGDVTVAEVIGEEIVTIPLFTDITREQQDYVIDTVGSFFYN